MTLPDDFYLSEFEICNRELFLIFWAGTCNLSWYTSEASVLMTAILWSLEVLYPPWYAARTFTWFLIVLQINRTSSECQYSRLNTGSCRRRRWLWNKLHLSLYQGKFPSEKNLVCWFVWLTDWFICLIVGCFVVWLVGEWVGRSVGGPLVFHTSVRWLVVRWRGVQEKNLIVLTIIRNTNRSTLM
jgi:hypothetical protein